ncbi:MAG: BolA/IbaG family iron-sulfur metabolism protein [Bdellovibrionia bacterium]
MTPQDLQTRIEKTYPDAKVEVVDLTGGQDHYQVFVETASFKGLSRIQQHKAVMDIFALELKSGEVHALTIRTSMKEIK